MMSMSELKATPVLANGANLPDALQPDNLPASLLAAYRGDVSQLPTPEVDYELPGGGRVTIFRISGSTIDAGIVTMNGPYPEPGKVARNRGRTELLSALEGEGIVPVNGQKFPMTTSEAVLVGDNAVYSIEGNGKFLVLVEDSPDGATEIIDPPA